MFCSFEISLLAIHSCPMMQAPSTALITVRLGQVLHRCPYWCISKQYNSCTRNNIYFYIKMHEAAFGVSYFLQQIQQKGDGSKAHFLS